MKAVALLTGYLPFFPGEEVSTLDKHKPLTNDMSDCKCTFTLGCRALDPEVILPQFSMNSVYLSCNLSISFSITFCMNVGG